MSKRSNRALLGILSLIIVVLVISTAYLVSVVQMGQFAKLATNDRVNISSFGKAVRLLQVRYSGYLTLIYNASSSIYLTVSYSYAGHNFTATYFGSSNDIRLAVLPAELTLTFYTAFGSANVRYNAILEY
ncbi:MAG: hypothetical protein KIS30_08815 [Thermoplasmata archaeon]|nr:hypothetical protein [Candidatus Sysuiplasma acidicola]MBX8646840.1 hypothetical protein [Candidatus Sysuiplasma acidicola]